MFLCVKEVVSGGCLVYIRVGDNGMRLEVLGNVGEADEVSEPLREITGKSELEVPAEEHSCVTKVNGGTGVLLASYVAGDTFLMGVLCVKVL